MASQAARASPGAIALQRILQALGYFIFIVLTYKENIDNVTELSSLDDATFSASVRGSRMGLLSRNQFRLLI